MRNITCPGCGFDFETDAVTNTRCRRCRRVVNIGASLRRPTVSAPKGRYEEHEEPFDKDEEGSPGGWVGAVLVGAAAVALAILLGRRPPPD